MIKCVFIIVTFNRMAVKTAAEENDEFQKLCVYVAQDCAGVCLEKYSFMSCFFLHIFYSVLIVNISLPSLSAGCNWRMWKDWYLGEETSASKFLEVCYYISSSSFGWWKDELNICSMSYFVVDIEKLYWYHWWKTKTLSVFRWLPRYK